EDLGVGHGVKMGSVIGSEGNGTSASCTTSFSHDLSFPIVLEKLSIIHPPHSNTTAMVVVSLHPEVISLPQLAPMTMFRSTRVTVPESNDTVLSIEANKIVRITVRNSIAANF
ncbi:MAG: hypothetical protein KDB87_20160, partial [Flavobacteriales bacterium]|nr:hypothetical protein [Flavobacteriales bacterium]